MTEQQQAKWKARMHPEKQYGPNRDIRIRHRLTFKFRWTWTTWTFGFWYMNVSERRYGRRACGLDIGPAQCVWRWTVSRGKAR